MKNVKRFFEWLKQQQSSDLIKRYRQDAEQTRQELLAKALVALTSGQDSEKVLNELSYKTDQQLITRADPSVTGYGEERNSQGLQSFSKALKLEEQ
ncbi:glutamyl-tRNA reductase [Actinobacillus pleuropneumoniae]|nr:glutamyl-tRNA reductase [Actinobacillus pleuropneumoniae]